MESVHLRCPQCQKLFVLARSEITSDRPEFRCDGCSTRFYMPFPQATEKREFQTFVTDPSGRGGPKTFVDQAFARIAEEKTKSFNCPFCQAPNQQGSVECASCQRVLEKAKKISMEIRKDTAGSELLRTLWGSVLADYASEARHEAFIQQALSDQGLQFASQQYRQILDANPNEAIAMKMRERIINLATLTYIPQPRAVVKKKWMSLPIMLIFVGMLLCGTGFVFETLRSIIPVGAVIITLGVGFVAVAERSGIE